MEFTIPILIAITTAVIQIIKGLNIKSELLPVLSMVMGVIVCFIAGIEGAIGEIILQGILIGLGASGLYDFTKLSLGGVLVKE
jgi:hypothetical protein